jgi:hypothetical protein
MTHKVIIEFEGGYTDTTEFCVLKYALKWMDWLRSHPLHGMISITLENV